MPSVRQTSVAILLCVLIAGVASATVAASGVATLSRDTGLHTTTDANDTNRSAPATVTIERAPGHLPPVEAADAATPTETVRADEWLLVTVDADRVLGSINGSTELAAGHNGTDGVVLSMEQTNPAASLQAHEIDVGSLLGRVNATAGTITYFYDGQSPTLRSTDLTYRVRLDIAATNDAVSRRHTVTATVQVDSPNVQIDDPYLDDPRNRGIVPNRPNVTVPLVSQFPPSKPLSVRVVGPDGTDVVPRRTVTANETGRARTAVDLSAVTNGTHVALVVVDGHTDRPIARQQLLVGRVPDPGIADVTQDGLLPVDATGRVTVTVDNAGTATFVGPVEATFAGQRYTRRVQIPARTETAVTFDLQTPPNPLERADFTVTVGDSRDYQPLALGAPTIDAVDVGDASSDPTVAADRRHPLRLTVVLANDRLRPAETSLTTTLDDRTMRRRVTVEATDTARYTLSVPVADLPAGSYNLTLGTGTDSVTRTLSVRSPTASATPTERSTPAADGPGFGLLGVVLALLCVAWYRLRL